jgi:hypothetical protein
VYKGVRSFAGQKQPMRQAVLTLLLLTSAHAAMAFPCWTTVQAGIDDNFTLPPGQDPANLTPELMFAVGQSDPSQFVGFNADNSQINRFFGHSFQLSPPPYPYLHGTLRLHLQALFAEPHNDTLVLWAGPSGESWAVNLSDLVGHYPSAYEEMTLDLDLSTLLTQSGTPLLAHISQYGVLHVFLEDDTSVDDMTLNVDWCPPPPPIPLVGVIKGLEGCGSMPEYDVFFDNEDSRNANRRGGWIGATESGGNTLLRLCGVDGTIFEPAAAEGARFALVALSNTCPTGFTRFDRYHDNEDNRPASWDTAPSGSPTDTVGSANTNMAFCVATGSNAGVANSSFPNIGVSYGVFGGRTSWLSSWALDRGYIFLDDQDGGNANQPSSPPAYTWEFLEAGGNTTYYMARVK